MGEIVLSQAGSVAGAALLPNGLSVFGQSISGTTLGRTLGGLAGQAIDASLLSPVEGPRIKSLQILESRDGAGLPLVYGRMRVGGQVIWASRFKEKRRETAVGKGGPKYVDYTYSVSFAVALAQGPITRIDRVWANGDAFALRDVNWRLYHGTSDQLPDPLIEAIEGAGQAPAYRDTAYIVFEDLPLDAFGNRLPQLSFEVVRAEARETDALAQTIQGVNIIPASGEFVYATSIVRERRFPGIEQTLNLNNARGDADFVVSLDQLQSDLPNAKHAALTVAWFGDDLRAGHCKIRPGVERRNRVTVPYAWTVDQADRGSAHLISQTGDSPNYGGTPADEAVLEGIAAMKAAGIAVTLSPFLLMDIPAGNNLSDPYGWGEQAAFPWRGRITISADKTETARAEIEAFIGEDGAFGFRHFILHHARLAVRAGGVDTILIGSEMVALTRVRDAQGRFPFVEALQAIAAEVKAIVGEGTSVSYAANWTEYGAYAPGDGSRDVLFPLDALWASDAVDFVGVDWYPPTGDWRDGETHLDALAGYKSADDPRYLQRQLVGGEAYDWYYASSGARDQQIRSPIIDGAFGEHWIFRAKDLLGWWTAEHFARPGGTRAAEPTAWRAGMKPVRIVEIGFPAVDKGANAPNVFVDPKSSESALPYYSNGVRDDLIQRRALETSVAFWQAQSPIEQVLVWAWDGRPWPDFPAREEVWSDGPNWQFGHWLNGRTSLIELSSVVTDLALRGGAEISADQVNGVVDGYALENVTSLASALTPLIVAYDFHIRESESGLIAADNLSVLAAELDQERVVEGSQTETIPLLDKRPSGVSLSYISGDFSYQPAVATRRHSGADQHFLMRTALPLVLTESRASNLAEAQYQALASVNTAHLSFAPGPVSGLEIADAIRVDAQDWRVERIIDEGIVRRVELRALAPQPEISRAIAVPGLGDAGSYPAIPAFKIITDGALGGAETTGPMIAVSADPWAGAVIVSVGATLQTLQQKAIVAEPAGIGEALSDFASGVPGQWDETATLDVRLPGEALSSADEAAIIDGANRLLIEHPGGWEMLAYRSADLIAADEWRLTGLWRGLNNRLAPEGRPGLTVILADDRLVQVPLDEAQIGVALWWQVGAAAPVSLTYQPMTDTI